MTPDGVHVDGGVKLARPQRLSAVQGVAGAVRRGARRSPVTLGTFLFPGVLLTALLLWLLLLPPLHVMDAHSPAACRQPGRPSCPRSRHTPSPTFPAGAP